MPRFVLLFALLVLTRPLGAADDNTVFLSKEEALAKVFPQAERVLELRHLLQPEESARVESLLGATLDEGGFFTYVALRGDDPVGYAVVVSQIGKVKPITHIVAVSPAGVVTDVAVMIYRESHGAEVAAENFTEQYRGKTLDDTIRIDFDVVNIAGATLSGHALCKGVRKSLAVVQTLFLDADAATHAARLRAASDVTPRVLAAAADAPRDAAAREPGHLRVERRVMGSVCSVEAHAPAGMSAATLTRAVDAALDEVERWDAVLSDWNPDTPLSRFNAAPADEPQPLSSDLAAWLAHATHWSARTEGAFDPTLGALVDAWGLRSRNPARPGPLALRSARDASALALLRFDPETRSATRLHAGLRLDPGASGKGWALGRARDVLVEHGVGRALLSFRSTLVALDPPPGEDGWRVPVAHDGSAEALLEFELVRQALSVSGGSLRGFDDGGVLRGHVIDATSGTPVPAGRLAWVLHDDPATSDALATALLVARDDLAPVDGAHGGWVDAADAELHTWGRAP